jgi:uncharacterized SAM-binding protein YcdF (DUF218 family)
MLRRDILAEIGSYLIDEQPLDTVEVLFVLGGNSFDRGNEAARLYNTGYVNKIVCVGGNVPSVLKVLNKEKTEGELCALQLSQNRQVSTYDITVMSRGTSTMEEVVEVGRYCKAHKIQRAMVLSSKFHTRRIRGVVDKVLDPKKIEILVRGAPSSKYSEMAWWHKEEGMIMVNNEYAKLLYYFIKY